LPKGHFIPAILLPTNPNGGKAIDSADLGLILDGARQLKTDIAKVSEVSDLLNRLFTSSSAKGLPLQAYFLTRTGLMAYRPATNQASLRSPTRVYFAQRPYFWDTVTRDDLSRQSADDGRDVDERLDSRRPYITQPYFDLVGKGVVVTACNLVRSPFVSESTVCLDFPQGSSATDPMKPWELNDPVVLSCDIAVNGTENLAKGGLTDCHNGRVNTALNRLNERRQYDYLTGGVFVLQNSDGNQPQAVHYFTIPVNRDEQHQQLRLYAIDGERPFKVSRRNGILFSALLLLAACV